ncbi:MAG: hypothetical protein A2Y91_03420 [Chloroflexi bacterium RBG_13_54_8]|nr:MAG: hypothetical protein A2Y91_03420 [Chloroflexi bacterium RBG_13_54_8]
MKLSVEEANRIKKINALLPIQYEIMKGIKRVFSHQESIFLKQFEKYQTEFSEALNQDDLDKIMAKVAKETQEEMGEIIMTAGGKAMELAANARLAEMGIGKPPVKTAIGLATPGEFEGIGIAFDLSNPKAVEWLANNAALRVTQIDDTTRETIGRIVKQGVDEGWSYNKTAKEISSRFEEFRVGKPQEHIASRAHLVAVTESANSYEVGNKMVIDQMTEAGLKMVKKWQTVNDNKVSDECQRNQDDDWIAVDQEHTSGDMHPPRFPGCRCDELYQRAKGKEIEEADRVEVRLLRGEKGDQGEPGLKGEQGLMGEAGIPGPQGDEGEQGSRGVPGEKGDNGDRGFPGQQGIPGVKGDKGDKGERGSEGKKGDKGEEGERGERGKRGRDGQLVTTVIGGGGGGGVTTFLALTDTPASYVGQAGNVATVNPGETALVFQAAPPPGAHHLTHENGGADEINIAGLSGVADDDQHIIDAEAITAMGVLGDANPLNHNRYTDGEALIQGQAAAATHSALTTGVHGVGAGTVAKTADIVATKLDDFATPDDNTDLDVSTTRHGLAPKAIAPAAGLVNVYGIANGETAITNKALFDATSPSTQAIGDAAAVGTATVATRRDHKHAMPSQATMDSASVAAINAAGVALADGKNIQLGALAVGDHTYSCAEVDSQTAGENLVFGEVCYMKSDGKLWKAKADAVATMPGIAIALATIAADAPGLFAYSGKIRDDTWNWTIGKIIFVSAGTGGALTETAPAVATNFVQPVGVAFTADIILMKPSLEMVEVA